MFEPPFPMQNLAITEGGPLDDRPGRGRWDVVVKR